MRSTHLAFWIALAAGGGLSLLVGGVWMRSLAPTSTPKEGIAGTSEEPKAAALAVDWDLSSMQVAVTGREFTWRFHLPGPDGRFETLDDIRVKDELHLPLNCDTELLVQSDDYVYTLSIPDLGLRKIAIPELVYKLQFQTSRAGTFDVIADPMCSVRFFHDDDMGVVVIEPTADFKRWYARQREG